MQFDLQDMHQLSLLLKWYLPAKVHCSRIYAYQSQRKLLGSNKRRKRTIKADNLHALIVHIWILVCYQLPFGPHLHWRLENSFRNILEHSSYISSPSTSYAFSTYRRLIMRSEVLKGWTSHSPNLFYDDRYLDENLLISKNKEAFLCQSVCM